MALLSAATPAAAGDGCPKYWYPDRSGERCVSRDRRLRGETIPREVTRSRGYDDDLDYAPPRAQSQRPRYYDAPPPRQRYYDPDDRY